MFVQIVRSLLFSHPADFPNENNTFGFGIFQEHLQTINEICTIEGVTSDTDTQSLPQTYYFVTAFLCGA